MRLYRRTDGGTWWVEFRFESRHIRQSLKTKDRAVARARAAEIHRTETCRGTSLETPREVPRVRLTELLAAYEGELERRGRSPKHVQQTIRNISRLARNAGAAFLDELTPEAIERGLSVLRGQSSRAQNYALGAMRSLLKWAVRTGRTEANPADKVDRVRSIPKRTPRRALTAAEFHSIISLESIPLARRLVYAVASITGLRRSELGRLRREHVDLVGGVVSLPAELTKGKRAALRPLPPEAVELWRCWLVNPVSLAYGLNRVVKGILPPVPTVQTFYRDLERAGVFRRTDDGVLDVQALRVTFGTAHARENIHPTLTQEAMRHTDPKLTANVYTKLGLGAHREAIGRVASTLFSGGIPRTGAHPLVL